MDSRAQAAVYVRYGLDSCRILDSALMMISAWFRSSSGKSARFLAEQPECALRQCAGGSLEILLNEGV